MLRRCFYIHRVSLLVALFVMSVCLCAKATESAPQNIESIAIDDVGGDYGVIYEHNIFSSNRGVPVPPQPHDPKVKDIAIYVLRGIAAQNDERVAFVEEQINGSTLKVKMHTKVLKGQITEIYPDCITFEEDGQARVIRIGEEIGKVETTVVTDISGDKAPRETSAVRTKRTMSLTSDNIVVLPVNKAK